MNPSDWVTKLSQLLIAYTSTAFKAVSVLQLRLRIERALDTLYRRVWFLWCFCCVLVVVLLVKSISVLGIEKRRNVQLVCHIEFYSKIAYNQLIGFHITVLAENNNHNSLSLKSLIPSQKQLVELWFPIRRLCDY